MFEDLIQYHETPLERKLEALSRELHGSIESRKRYKGYPPIPHPSTNFTLRYMTVLRDETTSNAILHDNALRKALMQFDHTEWMLRVCTVAHKPDYVEWLLEHGWGEVVCLSPSQRTKLKALLTGRPDPGDGMFFRPLRAELADRWLREWITKYSDLFFEMQQPTLKDLEQFVRSKTFVIDSSSIAVMRRVPELNDAFCNAQSILRSSSEDVYPQLLVLALRQLSIEVPVDRLSPIAPIDGLELS